jgi:hypothetical protein
MNLLNYSCAARLHPVRCKTNSYSHFHHRPTERRQRGAQSPTIGELKSRGFPRTFWIGKAAVQGDLSETTLTAVGAIAAEFRQINHAL